MSSTWRVLPPARAMVSAVQARVGRAWSAAVSLGVRARSVTNPMPRSAVGQLVLGGDLAVEDQQLRGRRPVTVCQWSAKERTSLFWVALARSALA